MNTKNLGLIVLALLFSVLSVNAQSLANYTVQRNTGLVYTSIAQTGSAFANWRNTGNFSQDDNRSELTDIGFDFWYNGVRYTQFCVSTNGFIDFSSSTDNGAADPDDFGYDNSSFTSSLPGAGTMPAIAPFYDDLMVGGAIAPLSSSVKYLVSGTAPSRTLTVEWINMTVFQNGTPSLNFQVQLVEGSGVIFMNYGSMNAGSYNFSYTTGLNGPTVSLVPLSSQLKTLQSANSNVFSNLMQNNLITVPQSNSQYRFFSSVPANASGTLTAGAVTQTGMTLNWNNWANNETGYVIYQSTDNVNFSFVQQTPANAVSSAINGLSPSTLYYWRVYAVTEGALSTALTATQATSGAGTKTSVNSGNWNNASLWVPAGVPAASDNVIIASGHDVAINTNASCNSLTVGLNGPASLRFSTNTARSFTVNGNLVIQPSASLHIANSSNTTHSLTVGGDIINNGILNLATDGNSLCNLIFNSNRNQVFSGNGALSKVNRMFVNKNNAVANAVEISAGSFTAPVNFLSFNSGYFKLTSTGIMTLTPFSLAQVIPAGSALLLNAPNAVIYTGDDIVANGSLTIQSGTMNIGNAVNEHLQISGGKLIVNGGELNVNGLIYAGGLNSAASYEQNGGTVRAGNAGSNNTVVAPFDMSAGASRFVMNGGRLVVVNEGGDGSQDLGMIINCLGAVNGGTIQMGDVNSITGQQLSISSNMSLQHLEVNSANITAKMETDLEVKGDLSVISGTLNSNAKNIQINGSWSNKGGFLPTTAIVHFKGNTTQYIFGQAGAAFNHLYFSGTGVKTFSSNVLCSGNFSVATSSTVDVSSGSLDLSVKGNFTNNGFFNARSGLVLMNGSTAQQIGGTSTTSFFDLTLNNPAGLSLASAQKLRGTLQLNSGTFNTNAKVFTLVSTAGATGRIGSISSSANITGNVTAERFAPGGATGWALLASPVASGLTFQAWDDDMYITCPTCPDGFGGFNSIYSYNETVSGSMNAAGSYVPMSALSQQFVAGKGYWVYLGTGQYTTNPINIDVTGAVNKFNINIPLTYSNYGQTLEDGWNLISNPYPSPISWNALRGSTANLDNAIYVYNADLNSNTGGYAAYVNGISSPAVGSGGIGDVIPMGQAFYVHSTGATALQATEAIKTSGNQALLKVAGKNTSLVRILMRGGANYKDECVIYEENGATKGFEARYDAFKLGGMNPAAPKIGIKKDTLYMQVNGIPKIAGTYTTYLKASTGYSGSYTLSASQFSTFVNGACISLYDRFTSTNHNLANGPYVFNLADTTTASRFILSITVNSMQVNMQVTQPTCASPEAVIIASPAGSGPWTYTWKNSAGKILKTDVNATAADTSFSNGGAMTLEISSVANCAYYKNTVQVNGVTLPIADFTAPDSLKLLQSGDFKNHSQNANSYLWEFGDGNATTKTHPKHLYTASGYFRVRLIASSVSGCKDTLVKRIYINAEVTGIAASDQLKNQTLVKRLGGGLYLIEFNSTSVKGDWQLIDGTGRVLEKFTTTGNKPELNIDLSKYASGVYYLSMEGRESIKLIGE